MLYLIEDLTVCKFSFTWRRVEEPVNGYLSLRKNNYFRFDVVVKFYTTLCLDGVCVRVSKENLLYFVVFLFFKIFDSNIILRVFVDASSV